jgi:membrane fusion protein (multidrug efflux system)
MNMKDKLEGSKARAISKTLIIGAPLLILGLVIVTTLSYWTAYRFDHLVVNQAQVAGNITHLGARLDGRLQEVLVDAGQRVQKGDLLAVLDNQHLKAALGRAQAEHQAASADLNKARVALKQERAVLQLTLRELVSLTQSAEAEAEAADRELEKIDQELDRIRRLAASGVSSASDLDRLQGSQKEAEATLRAKQAFADSVKTRTDRARQDLEGLVVKEAELKTLEAQVEVSQGRVEEAQANLEASFIRAPESGWVIQRIVQPGGSAKVGQPLVAVWLGTPWVEAWINEKSLRDVRLGSPVEMEVAAYPELELLGTVSSIGVQARDSGKGPSSFERSASVPIRITLDEVPQMLQPGLSVLAGIEVEDQRKTHFAGFMNRMISRARSPLLGVAAE